MATGRGNGQEQWSRAQRSQDGHLMATNERFAFDANREPLSVYLLPVSALPKVQDGAVEQSLSNEPT